MHPHSENSQCTEPGEIQHQRGAKIAPSCAMGFNVWEGRWKHPGLGSCWPGAPTPVPNPPVPVPASTGVTPVQHKRKMETPGPLLAWHNCLQGWKGLIPRNQPLGKAAPPLWAAFPFPAPSWPKPCLSFPIFFFTCSLGKDGIRGGSFCFPNETLQDRAGLSRDLSLSLSPGSREPPAPPWAPPWPGRGGSKPLQEPQTPGLAANKPLDCVQGGEEGEGSPAPSAHAGEQLRARIRPGWALPAQSGQERQHLSPAPPR